MKRENLFPIKDGADLLSYWIFAIICALISFFILSILYYLGIEQGINPNPYYTQAITGTEASIIALPLLLGTFGGAFICLFIWKKTAKNALINEWNKMSESTRRRGFTPVQTRVWLLMWAIIGLFTFIGFMVLLGGITSGNISGMYADLIFCVLILLLATLSIKNIRRF